MTAFAEYFSRELSVKTSVGKQARTRNGKSNGKAPFGYTPDWQINEEEAAIVRELFARYASGNYAYGQLS